MTPVVAALWRALPPLTGIPQNYTPSVPPVCVGVTCDFNFAGMWDPALASAAPGERRLGNGEKLG
eukprot:COSAG01_NODE_8470_length_2774_cov_1.635888_6_plen_65_part_00